MDHYINNYNYYLLLLYQLLLNISNLFREHTLSLLLAFLQWTSHIYTYPYALFLSLAFFIVYSSIKLNPFAPCTTTDSCFHKFQLNLACKQHRAYTYINIVCVYFERVKVATDLLKRCKGMYIYLWYSCRYQRFKDLLVFNFIASRQLASFKN